MHRNAHLLKQLSDTGIAPRHLLRIDAELRDHYEDLRREASASCESPAGVVVESTDRVFEQAAVEAAYRFKYRPRVVRGQAVEVPGVRNRISFDIPV